MTLPMRCELWTTWSKMEGGEGCRAGNALQISRASRGLVSRAQGPYVDLRYGTTIDSEARKRHSGEIEYIDFFLHVFDHLGISHLNVDDLKGWRVVDSAGR